MQVGSSAWHQSHPFLSVASGTTVTNSHTMTMNGVSVQTGGTALGDI